MWDSRTRHRRLPDLELVRLLLSPLQKSEVFDDVDETGWSRGLAIRRDVPPENVLSRDDLSRGANAFQEILNDAGYDVTEEQARQVLNEVDSGSEVEGSLFPEGSSEYDSESSADEE
jgi:hypothetical protein